MIFLQGSLCQLWLSWPSGLEKIVLNFVNVFLLFHYYLLLEKVVALHLNKTDFPSPKDAMCQVQLKLAQWYVLEKILDS